MENKKFQDLFKIRLHENMQIHKCITLKIPYTKYPCIESKSEYL